MASASATSPTNTSSSSSSSSSGSSLAPYTATGSPLNALRQGLVDAVVVDAAQAYLGISRYGFRVIATEIRNGSLETSVDPSDTLSTARPTILIRTSSTQTVITNPDGSTTTTTNDWSFANLKGKRVCLPSLNDPSVWLVAAWARMNNATTSFGMRNIAPQSQVALDYCSSELYMDITTYFSSGVCAPPATEGEVGTCSICSSGSYSCGQDNPYAGDIGALRGLSESLCDVAVLRSDVLQSNCGGSVKQSWCLPSLSDYTTVTVVKNNAMIFGKEPTKALVIRQSSLSTSTAFKLQQLVLGMNYHRELLTFLSISTFAAINTTRHTSIPLDPGSEAATTAYISLLSEQPSFSSISGIYPYMTCSSNVVGCAASIPTNCYDKGKDDTYNHREKTWLHV